MLVPPGNNLLPLFEILHLPDIPRAIDHSVVQPEGRVAGRCVEVGPGVSGDGEVAARVHAVLGLHLVLECADGGRARDEGGDLGGRAVARCEVVGEIALDAAGVVAVAVASRVAWWCGVGHGSERAGRYVVRWG